MGMSTESPRQLMSLSLQSFSMLPAPPLCERLVVSSETNDAITANLDDFRLPFPTINATREEKTHLRLSVSSTGSEELVTNALKRMSAINGASRAIHPIPSPIAPIRAGEKEETNALVERMSRLMPANDKRRNRRSTGDAAKEGRSVSPLPLARGVRRTHSGAALCA